MDSDTKYYLRVVNGKYASPYNNEVLSRYWRVLGKVVDMFGYALKLPRLSLPVDMPHLP